MATTEHTINMTSLSSNTKTEMIYALSKTAADIALQNFEGAFLTMVYFNTTIWIGAEVFLKLYNKAVVIGRGTFYPKFGKIRQYVLFGNSVTDIVPTLQWMRAHEFDNTGKYIIVCQSPNAHNCDETFAMQILWEYKITNVIFLKSVENQSIGFTYFPLNDTTCTYDVPVRLVSLISCLNSVDIQESCNLFPIKLANLNGCPLIVSTFLQLPYMEIENGIPSGSDGDLLRLIAEKLNGNLTVMTPKIGDGWGVQVKDGSWSGSLADIYYDYANFSITSAALTQDRYSFFQFSKEYNSASVVWITHPAKKIPSSLKLTYPFQQSARIPLTISFVVVVICSLIIRSRFCLRVSPKIKLELPRSSVTFYSWMLCMGQPALKLPTKTALLYIVILWIWYCNLVRTFYQVTLISAMKANYYHREFETIDDAIVAKYTFGGGYILKNYYIDYPNVYNRWKEVLFSDFIHILRNVSKGMEFVLAMKMETAKIVIWKEKLHVHMLPQKIVTCPTVLFFKKFSPLADAVDDVLIRLVESGFSDKLQKNYAIPEVSHETGDYIESIKMEHYTGCYAILITGWIISFLFALAEIIYEKIYPKHNNSRYIQYCN